MSEQNIKRDMLWNTIGNIVYYFCQWVITVLVVHLASFEAAGYLSLAMTTSSSFSAISLFSMRNFQISDVKGEFTDGEYTGSRILTCLIAMIACGVYAFWKTSAYQALCIVGFMLIRLAESWVDVLHGVNQKFGRYDLIGKSFLLRGCLTIVSFVVGLRITGNILLSIVYMAVLNLFVACVIDWRNTNRLEKIHPVLWNANVKVLLEKCTPLVITYFLLSLIVLVPKQALQEELGNEILGIYSSISSPVLVVQVFAQYMFNPLVPRFSVMLNNHRYEEFRKKLKVLFLMSFGFGVFVLVFAKLLGPWGLHLLFGDQISDYTYLLIPLVFCTLATAYVWILASLAIAMRYNWQMAIGMAISYGVCMFGTRAIIHRFGVNGTSYSTLLSLVIFMVYLIGLILKGTGERANEES